MDDGSLPCRLSWRTGRQMLVMDPRLHGSPPCIRSLSRPHSLSSSRSHLLTLVQLCLWRHQQASSSLPWPGLPARPHGEVYPLDALLTLVSSPRRVGLRKCPHYRHRICPSRFPRCAAPEGDETPNGGYSITPFVNRTNSDASPHNQTATNRPLAAKDVQFSERIDAHLDAPTCRRRSCPCPSIRNT